MEQSFDSIESQFSRNAFDMNKPQAKVSRMQEVSEMHGLVYETLPQVAERFASSQINLVSAESSKGLSSNDAEERLARDGFNELTPPRQQSEFLLLMKQFLNPFMVLLTAAGVLSCIAYGIDPTQTLNIVLGGVLFGVVLLTCLMSWWQERKTIKTMNAFRNILPGKAVVVRGGKREEVDARHLVVGDVVLLSLGSKVPADVRLLQCVQLKVENAAITGESEPVELDADVVYERGATPVEEAKNVAFNGSAILDGSGVGVIIATGDRSLIGRIASLTSETETRQSTLEVEVQRFVRFISILAISMAALFFIIDVARRSGVNALQSFINGFLVIIVANVPQGLPATVTSLQLIVAKRLATQNVFVKRLDAVETLGAVSLIASDKTGTLTMNKMTVVDGWVNGEIGIHYFSESLFVSPLRASAPTLKNAVTDGEKFSERAMPSVLMLQLIACVCNNAVESKKATAPADDDGMSIIPVLTQFTGNPSEVALLNFFEQFAIGSVSNIRRRHEVVFQIPFNSTNKFHAVVVPGSLGIVKREVDDTHCCTLMMKGAPEVLLKRCSRVLLDGTIHKVNEEYIERANEVYSYFARRGQRVLGFCFREFQGSSDGNIMTFTVGKGAPSDVPLDDLIFVGMLAIMDPPRPDVPDAVARCKHAGVKVFMVTGDHPLTAAAIAGQIKLFAPEDPVVHYTAGDFTKLAASAEHHSLVIHGQQLEAFQEDDWAFLLSHRNLVFSRTTPQHKLLITEKCQERKEIVCMTGDGVNDAPALKRANIGVSMGINGSEVAREASDVILMDDNFASIVLGVEQGRLLFDNLKKTIAYTLCHLAPEIVPVLLTLAFGFPPLLTSLQILSVDLFTELAPAISLAYEKKEKDIMDQPPRDVKKDRLVSGPLLVYAYLISGVMIEATACFLAACTVFWVNGIAIPDIAFNNGEYFVSQNPFVIVPQWGWFCSNGKCFSPDQQIQLLQQACGAWYIVLISSQVLHIWMVKTRRMSIFQHGISNMVMIYGVCIEAALMILFVAVPGLSNVLMGAQLPPGLAVLPIIYSGIALWTFNEGRKWWIRGHRKGLFAKLFFW